MTSLLALLAMLAEAAFGYPDRVFQAIGHPVSWIGRLIGALDGGLNRVRWSDRRRRAAGVCALALVVLVSGGGAWAIQALAGDGPGLILVALLGGTLLAQRSLAAHVEAVARALEEEGLAPGARGGVAHRRARPRQPRRGGGVARGGGEPGGELLGRRRRAGVLDGGRRIAGRRGLQGGQYRRQHDRPSHGAASRLRLGGGAARRPGQPARVAPEPRCCSIAAACLTPGASPARALRAVRRDAGAHRSPNAGWPEAAMAGALGFALAGPRRYGGVLVEDAEMGHGGRRDLGAADIRARWRSIGSPIALLIGLLAVVVLIILIG